jgi:hypothetical protein
VLIGNNLHPDLSGLFVAVEYGNYPVTGNAEHLSRYPTRCPYFNGDFLTFGKDLRDKRALHHPKVPGRIQLESDS